MHLISYFNTGSSCCNVQTQMKKSAEKRLEPVFTQVSLILHFCYSKDAQATPSALCTYFSDIRVINFSNRAFLAFWFWGGKVGCGHRGITRDFFFFQQRPHHMYAAFPWPCTYRSKTCQWLNNDNNDYNEKSILIEIKYVLHNPAFRDFTMSTRISFLRRIYLFTHFFYSGH